VVYQEWQGKDGGKRSKYGVVGRVSFGGRPDTEEAGGGDATA
jgi:hypothetical protein